MASLRKKPRSPYYFACFTLPDGRRVQRSTKFTKRKQAQDLADQWEHLSKERARAKQAHRVIADIYREVHAKQLPDSTPRAFVQGWLARRKGEVAPATYSAYETRSRDFLEFLATGAEEALAEIETRHFVAYRDHLAGRVSASTVNHGIKLLRVIFEDARRDGYVAENPAKECRLLKKGETLRRRPFSLDEIRKVLAIADDEWRSMILFGLYTGQRLGDLAKLTWANVDLAAGQGGEIHLVSTKTSRITRIPICNPLLAHIETLPSTDDPGAAIHPRAAANLNGSTLSRQFAEVLAAAGLREKESHDASKQGRKARRETAALSFHCLRHTATSLMKNAGVSPAVVQDIIGHDSVEMSAHYTVIDLDTKRRALDSAMPDLMKPGRAPKKGKGK
jgi:integrase